MAKAESSRRPDTPEEFLAELDAHRPELGAAVRSGLPDLDVASMPLLELVRREPTDPCPDESVLAAVRLLGLWRRTEAIPLILAALESAPEDDFLQSAAVFALGDMGEAAVEPLVAARNGADARMADALADALVQTRVKDERILEALLATLHGSTALGATLLGDYGDPRAIPALSRALDAFEVDLQGPLGNIALYDLEESIGLLDGVLTEPQREKIARARAVGDLYRRVFRGESGGGGTAPARKRERPGRNDPCRCGSGKKYKRCHLDEDEADEGRLH